LATHIHCVLFYLAPARAATDRLSLHDALPISPKLVRRADLKLMKPGSVIVDVAVDQGGCIETIHPTTHENPTYVVGWIVSIQPPDRKSTRLNSSHGSISYAVFCLKKKKKNNRKTKPHKKKRTNTETYQQPAA